MPATVFLTSTSTWSY